MSRYHHAVIMVIEGQLRMPCIDMGSPTTSMQLAACVPDLHVSHTSRKKSLLDPHLTKLL